MITHRPILIVSAILVSFGALLLPRSAFAQQPATSPASASAPLTIEERLAKLEAEVGSLRQENQQLRNQINVITTMTAGAVSADASVAPSAAASVQADKAEAAARKAVLLASSPGAAAAAAATPARSTAGSATGNTSAVTTPVVVPAIVRPGGSEEWISVGGFLMGQAEFGDAVDSRFALGRTANNRFYLRRARIVLGGHFAENFDFKVSSEMTGSLSEGNSMRGQLADGYISWTKFPALNLTMGQFKTGFGFEFLCNDLAVYTIEHSLVTDVLTLNRQVGAQASGTFFKARLNYALGIFNGTNVNTNVNTNDQFLYTARLTFMPVKTRIESLGWDAMWNIGVNGYRSRDTLYALPDGLTGAGFSGHRTGWGVDTQLTVGPWVLYFEYLGSEFSPESSAAAKFKANGWYLQGVWNILPKQWQAVVRYDAFDPNMDIAGNQTKIWTFGVNYLIKGDDLKLMLDYMTSDPRFRLNNYKNEERANRILFRLQAAF